MLHQANHVFGVLLDAERTVRDISRTPVPLKIDRDQSEIMN